MLETVLTVLLAVHLLSVDVAMAGPLACVWLEWRAGRWAAPAAAEFARRLAVVSLAALAVGMVLGGMLLGVRYLADDRAYFSAVGAIPRNRLWFGLAELVFSFGCLAAYVALWNRWRSHRVWHRLLALAGASNMLMHFPALFAVISLVSKRHDLIARGLDRAAYRRLLVDGEVLSLVAHVWLAAAAVTGIVIAALAVRTTAGAVSSDERERLLRSGAWLALVTTVLQIPVGVWVLLAIPDVARRPLLGDDWLATALFLGSLLLSLQLMHLLSAMAFGDASAKQVRRAIAVVSILVLLMAGTRLRLGNEAVPVTRTPVLRPVPARSKPGGAIDGPARSVAARQRPCDESLIALASVFSSVSIVERHHSFRGKPR